MDSVYGGSAPSERFSKPARAPFVQTLRNATPRTNTVSASAARAARRREARRDEQAVAAWLRELSGRTR
jgi:hypothetical protein